MALRRSGMAQVVRQLSSRIQCWGCLIICRAFPGLYFCSGSFCCLLTSVYLLQLAMHSIREMCAVDDCSHAYQHFISFFEDFSALDASIDVDSLGDAEIEGTYSEVPCNHVH